MKFAKAARFMTAATMISVATLATTTLPAFAVAPSEDSNYTDGLIIQPDVDRNGLVVIAPGANDAPKKARAVEGCGEMIAFGFPLGTWGPVSTSNCSLVGSPGHRKTYRWSMQRNSPAASACTQAMGFLGGKSEYWTGAGCGDSGSPSLEWGNVWANPKMKIASLDSIRNAQVAWS